ncbi:hypothetical protein [Clostridioides difficile]|uniref:hypothetical protein n=1 Tax=Clostridioides difficile TaxID=1496 RepID=UPI0021C9DE4A|nr:hypothetical protein [Clostridioides difficile]UUV15997.1 hypothetical protein NQ183_06825 [Clostridioides difficile]
MVDATLFFTPHQDDERSCSYHIKDVHKYSLSESEFSKDRDEEFKDSCEAMGVK